MTTFIILCAIMALIAVAAVCIPLWTGGRNRSDADRRAQVLAILRQQADDLEAEKAAGRIDADEYEETRLELERRVLDEARHEEEERSGKSSRVPRILAVILLVVIPASAVLGYYALGRYTAMDPHFIEMMEAQQMGGRGHSQREMQKMIDDLKARLADEPRNANGWFLLARTAAQMNRFDEAVEAFKRLNALVPNNADIMADMADMMAAANGKVITPDVEKVLKDALEIDPTQWKALALLAIHSWDRQHYAQAADYWERLLKSVPRDFPDREQIEANINEAKRLGGINDNISSVSPAAKDQAAADAAEARTEAPPTAAPGDLHMVAGTVTLDERLKSLASPEDTVFIYARPATGSRMPVAFTKVQVKDLPYNFELNETMRMAMGADTLATVKTVIVGARISKSGNFMPQPGDLEGEMEQAVEVGDRGLVVTIHNERK
ncbi:c-type cytochrome biogenesis protein CcmI [Sutterella sp.]|uniref:c-type cytochrome biogenesis protein CcmI n=1 Tax=Sutterella sp. TaxID=1981025 RepID=UPI0026DFBF14|nr:c-type cytochrome biogenesis protein CcmI [Sutterella sp.]MDO5531715.1 c-type cytochrome biogenesis protein CcmI [Sutterella sp.]